MICSLAYGDKDKDHWFASVFVFFFFFFEKQKGLKISKMKISFFLSCLTVLSFFLKLLNSALKDKDPKLSYEDKICIL